MKVSLLDRAPWFQSGHIPQNAQRGITFSSDTWHHFFLRPRIRMNDNLAPTFHEGASCKCPCKNTMMLFELWIDPSVGKWRLVLLGSFLGMNLTVGCGNWSLWYQVHNSHLDFFWKKHHFPLSQPGVNIPSNTNYSLNMESLNQCPVNLTQTWEILEPKHFLL